MLYWQSFILIFSVSLLVMLILSLAFKGKKKTDKGSQFVYYALSYRRKFIRTLWVFPLIAIIFVVFFYSTEVSTTFKVICSIIMIIVFLGQLGYNYYMWKTKE